MKRFLIKVLPKYHDYTGLTKDILKVKQALYATYSKVEGDIRFLRNTYCIELNDDDSLEFFILRNGHLCEIIKNENLY